MKKILEEHLLIFAFGFLGLLVLAGTLIINVFWGGKIFLPVVTNHTDLKDYMTLYISMLSVVATLFGGFVVIYAFDGWKEQYNKNVDATYYQEAINTLKNISSSIHSIKKITEELPLRNEGRSDIISDLYVSLRKVYENYLSDLQNICIFIDQINNDQDMETHIYSYISQAKLRIVAQDLEFSLLEIMEFDSLVDHIRAESLFHSTLINGNLKNMLTFLNSKVKA